ncbi:NYN domain protein [uncultured archaeon]|nr:NYN domain protein [uncultured archaeon]
MGFIAGGMTPVYRRVMVFIDGGYLRKGWKDYSFGEDTRINFNGLAYYALDFKSTFSHELIRVYYYDAIADPLKEQAKHEEQDLYFQSIRNIENYEVKLGRLIRSEGHYRQKGVDVLLAIDMITKAYEDQYDIAILIGGDDDLQDVVRAVKDSGKRVYGLFFEANASKRLIDLFDRRRTFNQDTLVQHSLIQKK